MIKLVCAVETRRYMRVAPARMYDIVKEDRPELPASPILDDEGELPAEEVYRALYEVEEQDIPTESIIYDIGEQWNPPEALGYIDVGLKYLGAGMGLLFGLGTAAGPSDGYTDPSFYATGVMLTVMGVGMYAAGKKKAVSRAAEQPGRSLRWAGTRHQEPMSTRDVRKYLDDVDDADGLVGIKEFDASDYTAFQEVVDVEDARNLISDMKRNGDDLEIWQTRDRHPVDRLARGESDWEITGLQATMPGVSPEKAYGREFIAQNLERIATDNYDVDFDEMHPEERAELADEIADDLGIPERYELPEREVTVAMLTLPPDVEWAGDAEDFDSPRDAFEDDFRDWRYSDDQRKHSHELAIETETE